MPALLDLLFPPRCASCQGPGWPLCGTCTDRVEVLTPPWCGRCGRPLEAEAGSCADCPPPPVARVRAPFLYEGPVAGAIKGMKFAGQHAIASHLAGAMAAVANDLSSEAVTWVPLSRRRLARRGFDQAEVLARGVAPLLGFPVRRLLARTSDGGTQARRAGAARRAAPARWYRAVAPVEGRVLLVDDVVTTGATAAACAGALVAAGAEEVSVLAAARALGGGVPRSDGIGRGARVR